MGTAKSKRLCEDSLYLGLMGMKFTEYLFTANVAKNNDVFLLHLIV